MADHSKIEWTEATWNPIAGCSIVSPGCTNCYAMRRVAPRLSANPATPHYHGTIQSSKAGPVWTGKIGIAGDRVLLAPLTWTRPRMVFVNSTSDLFHPDVPDEVIDRVFAVMGLAHWHTYQVLTKRPERMRQYFAETWQVPARPAERILDLDIPAQEARIEDRWDQINAAVDDVTDRGGKLFDHDRFWTKEGDLIGRPAWPHRPLPNVWLGTSVEDQRRADERIPHLLQTPAAVRFISAEPLLGPIDLTHLQLEGGLSWNALGRLAGLHWVIVGGESGNGARPMHTEWARSLRDQCSTAGVPYFFKQWGVWAPDGDLADGGERFQLVGKKAAGRLLDGIEHNAFPEIRP